MQRAIRQKTARSGYFRKTAAAIRSVAGGTQSRAPARVVDFRQPERDTVSASSSSQCRADAEGDSSCEGSATTGGWNATNTGGVPAEWLPPSEGSQCFADTIDASRFDFDVFAAHYVRHQRPLLIRGGARPGRDAKRYTRSGLLRAAANRKVYTQACRQV